MSVPIITVAQMRQWEEASWAAGRSPGEVIANAGREVALTALRLTRPNERIVILAGKGHNGDDAREAKPHLGDRRVDLLNIHDPAQDASALEALLRRKPGLVIDGLFGIGLNRPLDAQWTNVLEIINRAGAPVLAVDVPSGLNADTGEPQPVAVRAQRTVTFGAPKRGLLATPATAFVGRLEVAGEIGLIPCPFTEEFQWTEAGDFEGYPPARRVDSHKGTHGHVVILAGSHGYHGAAVLSARGALRARPGLVSVLCDAPVYGPVASQLQAAMVHGFQPPGQIPASCSALVMGPGLAAPAREPEWRTFVNEQWQTSPKPVLIDASALDWIEPGTVPENTCRVITPHPGEAARLLGISTPVVQQDRRGALRELSRRFGNCWVVLKGHQTLIGRGDGHVFVNPSGNPYLAQGGSGDVLAGFLGGLLAQASPQADPLQAIRYGVWKHGTAADALTDAKRTWTIEDLLNTIGD